MMPLFVRWFAACPPTPTLCAQPYPTTRFFNAALSSPFLSLQVLYMSCCGLLWTAYLSYASVVPQGAQPVVAGERLDLHTSPHNNWYMLLGNQKNVCSVYRLNKGSQRWGEKLQMFALQVRHQAKCETLPFPVCASNNNSTPKPVTSCHTSVQVGMSSAIHPNFLRISS